MAQLTWRAVLIGSCLGGVLSLTNLYIGLKAGWGFGVAITACILSYAMWTGLLKIGLVRTPMTILENNCMQSTASSAGYSTGSTLISAFAAYIIVNHQPLSVPLMLAWVLFIAVLGVTMAIPMKRQMINIDQLRFPSGIAAAERQEAELDLLGRGSFAEPGKVVVAADDRAIGGEAAEHREPADDMDRGPSQLPFVVTANQRPAEVEVGQVVEQHPAHLLQLGPGVLDRSPDWSLERILTQGHPQHV